MNPQHGATLTEHPDELPRNFGRYHVEREIGKGGMGVVYEATHVHLQRKVALKVLRRSLANDKRFLERFYREIKALGKVLDNTHVILATDGGEESGIPFLTMEFVEGLNLDQVLKEHGGSLPVGLACELIRQAALGLDAIHQQGLVHRDLKPTNLMLTTDGVVKILDLGLVRLCEDAEDRSELTPAHGLVGTLDYQAPEQAANPRGVDIRADIYSLGCTLYKLLTGDAPFGDHARFKKIDAHAGAPLPPMSKEIPLEVQAIVLRMLAKRPEQRYQTPRELALALAPYAEGKGSAMRVTASVYPAVGETPGPSSTPVCAQPLTVAPAHDPTPASSAPTMTLAPPTASQRRIWTYVAVGLLATLALAGGVSVYLTTRRGEPEPPASQGPPQLDQLKPLQSHYLLDHEPVAALKPRHPASSFDFHAKQRKLSVSCAANEHSLFHLGKVASPSYELQVRIFQSTWDDGIGVYLGYHPLATPQPLFQKTKDMVIAEFQLLKFHHGGPARREFRLQRAIGKLYRKPNGEETVYTEVHVSESLPQLFNEQTLTLVVENHRLKSVYVEKLPELERLVAREYDAVFGPKLHQGELGVWIAGATAQFRDASFRLR